MQGKKFSQELLKNFQHEATEDQRKVIEYFSAFMDDRSASKTFVLKGYAGTGKTTLIKSLYKTFSAFDYQVVLLAPTGRAAKVMNDYTGKNAGTIHRHIYEIAQTNDGSLKIKTSKKNESNTAYIVDEASMITNKEDGSFFKGARLLKDLYKFVNQDENCFLIFVGDTAQLPPVGEETSPALDEEYLRREFNTKVFSFEMKEVIRQAKDSGILMNATALRVLIGRGEKLPVLKTIGFNDVSNVKKENLEEELRRCYDKKMMDETLIVCRSNKQANQYNKFIRAQLLSREDEINSGDRMMVVKNNYYWLEPYSAAGFIANGDVLHIKKIRKFEDRYGFRFADATIGLIDYPDESDVTVKLLLDVINSESPSLSQAENKKLFEAVYEDYKDEKKAYLRLKQVYADPYFNALQVKFSYAVTCHKAQGGQWENVFVDPGYMTDEAYNKEYLRWLYTAVTRATAKLSFVEMDERFFRKE